METPIHGRLGAVVPSANTDTLLYLVPNGRKATININTTNKGVAATFRIAYVDATTIGSVATEDYLEYDAPLTATTAQGSTILRTGECINQNCLIMVRASTATVCFIASGIEEDI